MADWFNDLVGQGVSGLGGLLGGYAAQGSNAIPGLMQQAARGIGQLPGIRQPPPQGQSFMTGYSPGMPGPPTVQDIGIARGNMMQGNMLGDST